MSLSQNLLLFVHYLLNYYKTFHSAKKHGESAVKFVTVALLLFGVNMAIMYLLIHQTPVPALMCQVISSAVVLPIGYILNKLFTF